MKDSSILLPVRIIFFFLKVKDENVAFSSLQLQALRGSWHVLFSSVGRPCMLSQFLSFILPESNQQFT